MNSAVILNILVQISTSFSHICNNDKIKNMQRLNVLGNNSETTDYASTIINKSTIEPTTNPNNNDIGICVDVDNCKTQELGLTKEPNKEANECSICGSETNETICSTTDGMKNNDDKESQPYVFQAYRYYSHTSLSEPNSNYILRANKRIQNQALSKTCDNKFIKVGFRTDEIIEFIRAKKEKKINENKCSSIEKEIKLYFDFLEDQLAGLGIKKNSNELRRQLLHEYISARKERMIYYNTYKIFENQIKDLIIVENMKPCDDRIARDIAVAKEIINTIQNTTCLNVYEKNYIAAEQEFDLYKQFNLNIIHRFVGKISEGYPPPDILKSLEERVKFEYAEFNQIMPNDEEIKAFVKEKINSTDSGVNKILEAKKELVLKQKEFNLNQ